MSTKPSILIVEDDPIMALELREELEGSGYHIPEVVSDGDKVLAAVIHHRPDLIIMDIKLYGFRDGVDAANQIRAFYTQPIIYLSSYSHSSMAPRVDKTNKSAYIEKPYDQRELHRTIDRFLADSFN